MSEKKFRSGFVAILGRPNVGKSSIMNRIVGEKVAIVSNHPQTTRNKLLGVATGPDWQLVFVDTPGLHKPRTKLGEYMMKSASDAREGVDAVLAVVDGQRIGGGDKAVLSDIQSMNCPRFLAVNKIDIVPPEKLMPQLAELNEFHFDQIFSVSARTGENIDLLTRKLIEAMPEGPKYFPDDMITDQPERVM
ncbi:MAG: GTPase Era, partial [Clostridia bacterium]|nr:GTPase Era [Clostridia bacterium]